jgi:hypothetical protein
MRENINFINPPIITANVPKIIMFVQIDHVDLGYFPWLMEGAMSRSKRIELELSRANLYL